MQFQNSEGFKKEEISDLMQNLIFVFKLHLSSSSKAVGIRSNSDLYAGGQPKEKSLKGKNKRMH